MTQSQQPVVRLDYHPYQTEAHAAIHIRQFMYSTYGADAFNHGAVFQDMSGQSKLLFPPTYDANGFGRVLIIQSHGPVPPRHNPLQGVTLGKRESIEEALWRSVVSNLEIKRHSLAERILVAGAYPGIAAWHVVHEFIAEHPVLFDTVAIGLDVFGVVSDGLLTIGFTAGVFGLSPTVVGSALSGAAATTTAAGAVGSASLLFADGLDWYYRVFGTSQQVSAWEKSPKYNAIETFGPLATLTDPLREGLGVMRAEKAVPALTNDLNAAKSELTKSHANMRMLPESAPARRLASGTGTADDVTVVKKELVEKREAVKSAAGRVKHAHDMLEKEQDKINEYFAVDHFAMSHYRAALLTAVPGAALYGLNPDPIKNTYQDFAAPALAQIMAEHPGARPIQGTRLQNLMPLHPTNLGRGPNYLTIKHAVISAPKKGKK
ncbi:hypothetical protein ACOSOMT5_P1380 [Acidiphilium sp. MT5]